MINRTPEVVVLGGGISGLTVAWALKKAGVDVCLLEQDAQVGGCMRTEKREGFLLEKGPFNVTVRDPSFESLLDEVAGDGEIVTARREARFRYIYRYGRLYKVPTNPAALLTTGLLPLSARLRMLGGLCFSRRGRGHEETIEQVAFRRIGREATDTIVSAAISGIYSGDVARLSLPACFPSIAAADRRARSPAGFGLRCAIAKKMSGHHKRRWRGLVSLDGGLGVMTQALGEKLGSDCLTEARVRSLYHDPAGFTIVYDRDVEAHAVHARRVVLALPVAETARLLAGLLPEAAAVLSSVQSTSLAVLNMAYRRSDLGHPLGGFGFLVPRNEPRFPLMGVLWADSIFPHQAPPDQHLLRVFIGGARDPGALEGSDGELVESARRALGEVLGVHGEPTLVDVIRYETAIPQYQLGHRKRVDRFREALKSQPGLFAAGNYLEGVSLNDCVRVGTECAAQVVAELRGNATGVECKPFTRSSARPLEVPPRESTGPTVQDESRLA